MRGCGKIRKFTAEDIFMCDSTDKCGFDGNQAKI